MAIDDISKNYSLDVNLQLIIFESQPDQDGCNNQPTFKNHTNSYVSDNFTDIELKHSVVVAETDAQHMLRVLADHTRLLSKILPLTIRSRSNSRWLPCSINHSQHKNGSNSVCFYVVIAERQHIR